MDNSPNQGIGSPQPPVQPNPPQHPPLVTSTAPRPLGVAPAPGTMPPTPQPAPGQMPPPAPPPPMGQAPQPSFAPPPPIPPSPENPSLSTQSSPPSSGGGMVKKILAVVIGLFVVLGGLGGAFWYFNQSDPDSNPGNGSGVTNYGEPNFDPGSEQISLTYWGLWESESIMRPLFDEFTAKYPNITIEYVQQSPQDYRERLQSELVRDSGPDIFRFHNTWVPMLYNELDTLPDNIMTVSEYQQIFYPVIYKDMLTDRGLVGIPLMIDGLGLYYNKEMFATAGKQVPTDWEDLRTTAIDLTLVEGNQIARSGIPLGITSNVDHFSDILGLMIFQNKANPAMMYQPTETTAQDAVSFYLLFNKTLKIWNNTLPPSTYAFANEKAAMMIAPSWRAHEVAELNPELDFGIEPVPQIQDPKKTWATYWVEGVAANTQNKQAAWALLQFLSTPESLQKLYTNASQERLFGNPFPRVDMADQLREHEYLGAYIEQAPYAVSWPMASATYDNGINDRIIKYFEDLINSGEAKDENLQTVDSGVLQVLKLYQTSAN